MAAADSLQELRGEFAKHDMSTVTEEEDDVGPVQQDELTTSNTIITKRNLNRQINYNSKGKL